MTQVIRVLFAYPMLFLLQKIAERFLFYAGIISLSIVLLLSKEYISKNSPVGFVQNLKINKSKNSEQYSQERNTPNSIVREVTVKKGDTLNSILQKQNLPSDVTQKLIKLVQIEKISSQLKINQLFTFDYDIELIESPNSDLNEEKLTLNRMTFKIDKVNSIEFVLQDNNFVTHRISAPLKKTITRYDAIINSSVTSSLRKSGMSTNSIVKLINTYSHQIDFQRQIKPGDRITVLTEKFVTDKNEFSHHGEILFASIKTKNNEYNIYRYSPDEKTNKAQFFSENGSSIQGNLLRTPVKVVRISEYFGYRKQHPVLGYGTMHKGVDFAAAVGTPIYAAGNGTVEFIGSNSGYGRFIVLKHNSGLSTAYAHASRFAANLKRGSRVKQGDVIAFVGTSGITTGPHLHYEVRINGKHVNPMKFKTIPGTQLTGTKLERFKRHKNNIKNLGKKLNNSMELTAINAKKVQLF